jgi:hypothetical protein
VNARFNPPCKALPSTQLTPPSLPSIAEVRDGEIAQCWILLGECVHLDASTRSNLVLLNTLSPEQRLVPFEGTRTEAYAAADCRAIVFEGEQQPACRINALRVVPLLLGRIWI